jgi:hypothetical protein
MIRGYAMDKRADVPNSVSQFLTAEHFALQSARGTAINEANSRQQSYLGLLSAVVVALAFIAQVTDLGSTFFAFTLVLLPLVYFVGLTTLQRLHQIWGEWLTYQMGVNRIRHFFVEVDPTLADYLVMPTTDDPARALESVGIRQSRWQWMLGISGMIAVINSVVAGVFAGLAARQIDTSARVLPWLAGVLGFLLSFLLLRRMMVQFQRRRGVRIEPRFPDDQ